MKHLAPILSLFWQTRRRAIVSGLLLSFLVLLAGGALLGYSGWFITTTAAAGLAGVVLAFNVSGAGAGTGILALGRTAARYGERIATHDATLRVLALLRIRVLAAIARKPFAEILRQRRAVMLNRLTTDVDALDGLYLRLIAPVLAGLATLLVAFVLLAWLVGPLIALLVIAMLLLAAVFPAWVALQNSKLPARRLTYALDAIRVRTIDLSRGAVELASMGHLQDQRARVLAADTRARTAAERLDRIDRKSAALSGVLTTLAVALAYLLGARYVQSGRLDPALAGMLFFATLGLVEVVRPFQSGAVMFGRILLAAKRVSALISGGGAVQTPAPASPVANAPALVLEGVEVRRSGGTAVLIRDFSLTVAGGESVALTGPSGCGKSTLLSVIAGLEPAAAGRILIDGAALETLPEPVLRARLAMLSQRSALIAGTVRENLQLARPDAGEEALWQVIDIVHLRGAIENRGGLDAFLGEGGAGLSGGERRRLALARTLLRRPDVLLLDEATEGLDGETAAGTLAAIRAYLPQTAILMAAHRAEEIRFADRVIAVCE